ncbi:three-Cys-motif partner protein TcmP, partial [candidate division KSB1 bacterium]|nr:three-Cys-motif partner protein TcmP [candidate division KSB1 bacterium]
KVKSLREIAGQRDNVFIHNGDCNDILLSKIFPTVQWKDKRRALCLLDPYGLHLDWEVVYTAGRMRSIEIFLNFPVMDMNMNILRRSRSDMVDAEQINRMNKYWGGEVWQQIAYQPQETLFGAKEEKVTNERLAEGYRQRLMTVAGFKFVPKPLPMKNSSGSIVYYLFFASHNETGSKIMNSIFTKYR